MTDFTFNIKNFFVGTEKQVAVGILGTFSIDVLVGDDVLLTANDIMLRKRRDGKKYIESPSREYTPKGSDEKKRANYIRFWPDKKNWDKQEIIISLAEAAMEEAKASGGSRQKSSSNSNQSSSQPAASSSSNDMPW